MKVPIVIVFLLVSASAEMARFDNYRVYMVTVESEEQYEAMKYLEEHSDSYDFWEPPRMNKKTDIVVPPHKFSDFEDITKNLKMDAKLVVDNLQRLIDNQMPKKKQPKADVDALDLGWDDYHTLDEIYAWLDELQLLYPEIVNVSTIGYSFENRPIRLLTLSKKPGNRAIFIEGSLHAREWISPATATYLMHQLLTSDDPEIVDISENIDWHFVPVVNPDGYEYTWTSNRNWRKTRSAVTVLCFGVDGNRNFGFNWLQPDETGNLGGSRVPCTDTYAGESPYSEPETRATHEFLNIHAHNIDAFLALHSPTQMLLHPWGHSIYPPEKVEELESVGKAAAEAIAEVDGMIYEVGTANEVHFATSGTSRDHAYGYHNIPISFTVEMRGNGPYGEFGVFLPPEYILPNCREITKGFIALIHKAREFGRFKQAS